MEAVVLNRVGFLEYFCPKQGQDFKPSAAPLYPNMSQVPPPPPPGSIRLFCKREQSVLFTTHQGSLYQHTSLADGSFHTVASMYVWFRYLGKNQMRFAVFWRISVRFSDPPYAPVD